MEEQPADSVMWMIRGAWVTMTIRAACELGVLDRLDHPLTGPALAEATGSDPHATTRLLRALCDLGLVRRGEDDTYATTATGETLRVDHPSGVRNLALMQSWLPHVASWSRLQDAVRTGEGVYEIVNGMPSWEHLSRNPDVEAQFNLAMARRAAGQVDAILAGVDLAGVGTVVDVGGGRGAMLAGLLEACPTLTGVVADRPEVARESELAFAEAGLGERAHGVAADFFESVPAVRTCTCSPTSCTTGTTRSAGRSSPRSARRCPRAHGCSSSRSSWTPRAPSRTPATSTSWTCTCW